MESATINNNNRVSMGSHKYSNRLDGQQQHMGCTCNDFLSLCEPGRFVVRFAPRWFGNNIHQIPTPVIIMYNSTADVTQYNTYNLLMYKIR